MEIKELKKKIIEKKLMSIITLEVTPHLTQVIKSITDSYEDSLDTAHLLVFENEVELVYSDFDCDGYRSGSWNLSILSEVLDKKATQSIKHINSIVRDIVYMEIDEKEYFMITTDEYVIMMGQDGSDSYYPSNFFNIEDAKEKAIKDKKIVKGEVISQ